MMPRFSVAFDTALHGTHRFRRPAATIWRISADVKSRRGRFAASTVGARWLVVARSPSDLRRIPPGHSHNSPWTQSNQLVVQLAEISTAVPVTSTRSR